LLETFCILSSIARMTSCYDKHCNQELSCCFRWKTFTAMAFALYYIDRIFDIMLLPFLQLPEYFVHIMLLIITFFIRLPFFAVFCCCSCSTETPSFSTVLYEAAKDKEIDQGERSCNICYKFIRRMAVFGVRLRDSDERKKLKGEFSVKGVFHFIRASDSLNNYTNIFLVVAVGYIFMSAVYALHSDHPDEYWLHNVIIWVDGELHYELDLADFTLFCLFISARIMLRVVDRVYFLWALSWKMANEDEDKYSESRKSNMIRYLMCLIFCFGRRESTEELLKDETKPHGAGLNFQSRLLTYELWYVKIFCDENTFLKVKRRYQNNRHIKRNQLTLHKDMLCFICALVVSLVVKFFAEGSYGLDYLPIDECTAHRGNCIDDSDGSNCWCGRSLLNDVTTIFVVVIGGAMGSAVTVSKVMSTIFRSWRLKKVVLALECITADDLENVIGAEMVIPHDADITEAIYGHAINRESFKKKMKEKIQKVRKGNVEDFDNWYDEIMKDFKQKCDVTSTMKHLILKGHGNTVFKIGDIDTGAKPFLVVFGNWRGANLSGRTEGAREEKRDAVLYMHIGEKNRNITWDFKVTSDASTSQLLGRTLLECDDNKHASLYGFTANQDYVLKNSTVELIDTLSIEASIIV